MQLSLSDEVSGGWGYFNDHKWGDVHSMELVREKWGRGEGHLKLGR